MEEQVQVGTGTTPITHQRVRGSPTSSCICFDSAGTVEFKFSFEWDPEHCCCSRRASPTNSSKIIHIPSVFQKVRKRNMGTWRKRFFLQFQDTASRSWFQVVPSYSDVIYESMNRTEAVVSWGLYQQQKFGYPFKAISGHSGLDPWYPQDLMILFLGRRKYQYKEVILMQVRDSRHCLYIFNSCWNWASRHRHCLQENFFNIG